MSPAPSPTPGVVDRRNTAKRLVEFDRIKETLNRNWLLWIAPTLLFGIFGALYAIAKDDAWRASQAMLVRDEAIGELGLAPLGRFENNDALKRSLETIMQIAKNKQVIAAALRQLEPERAGEPGRPRDRDIESLQADINVAAAKGTEIGSSEVVYLTVVQPHRERAIEVAKAVCDQLERRMQELRDQHVRSIVAELTQKRILAQSELETATAELSKLEKSLGSDLGEMRTLAETGGSGDSNLRSQLNQIKVELRQAESAQETQQVILKLLEDVGEDTQALVATPNRLLESLPALSRLKDGLVDARLRTDRLKGSLTMEHPRVQAALQNEANIRDSLHQEISSAVLDIQADLAVSNRRVATLQAQLQEVQARLDRLASLRATYVNVTANVDQRSEQLREALAALSEAQGRKEAARTASLITRLDEPVTGSRPLGPGRLTLWLATTLGGLAVGLSLVYMVAPWQAGRSPGRRQADHQRSARTPGRRWTDRPNESAAATEVPTAAGSVDSHAPVAVEVADESEPRTIGATCMVKQEEQPAEPRAGAVVDDPALSAEVSALSPAVAPPSQPTPEAAENADKWRELLAGGQTLEHAEMPGATGDVGETLHFSEGDLATPTRSSAPMTPDEVLASKRVVRAEDTLHLNSLAEAVAKAQRSAHEQPPSTSAPVGFLEGTFLKADDLVDCAEQDEEAPSLEHLVRLLERQSKSEGKSRASSSLAEASPDPPKSTS